MQNSTVPSIALHEAWRQGLQQGISQVALNMIRDGFDLAKVVMLTGLSLQQIQHLQVNGYDDELSQELVRDFSALSESSLNQVWSNPEEDEAWKNL
jgi:hypothetical protein